MRSYCDRVKNYQWQTISYQPLFMVKAMFVELSLLHILTGVVVVQVKAIIKSSAYTGPK